MGARAHVDDGPRWRCDTPTCRWYGTAVGWWVSAWGVVQCLRCRTPSFRADVAAVGRSVLADPPGVDVAPLVDPIRTNQAIEGPFGRPAVEADRLRYDARG